MVSVLDIFTVVLIIAPLALMVLPILKIYRHVKNDGRLRTTSALGFLVFLVAVAVSRILFYIFDFVLTKFDPMTYAVQPAPSVYKAASLALIIGLSFLIYSLDSHFFQLKMKGIVAYCFLSVGVLITFIPVSTFLDYSKVSSLYALATFASFVFLIVVSFIHGGKVAPARLGSFLTAIGFIVYLVGILFTSAFFVYMFGYVIYVVSGAMHAGGLTLGAIGIFLHPLGSPEAPKQDREKPGASEAKKERPSVVKQKRKQKDESIGILRRKLALGEISEEDFLRKKQLLET
jgi:hypothetical protein